MTWKHILMGVCGFALGLWLCIPRDATLQPRWEVLVHDASGHGIPRAEVTEFRRDNVTPTGETHNIQFADSYGRVAFPPARTHTSPLLRGITCVKLKFAHGAQTPCGYQRWVAVTAPGYVETARRESPLPLKGRGMLLNITMQKAQ